MLMQRECKKGHVGKKTGKEIRKNTKGNQPKKERK